MGITGKLAKWDDTRGFGFIRVDESQAEVFVHISAFPRDGRRPEIGERIDFEIETDANGKKRARNLLCLDRRPAPKPSRNQTPRSRVQPRPTRMLPALLIGGSVALLGWLYPHFRTENHYAEVEPASAPDVVRETAGKSEPNYQCDGRTHCSQMHSCDEARFFLSHCPDTQMDGDGDGIPCEQQLCGH